MIDSGEACGRFSGLLDLIFTYFAELPAGSSAFFCPDLVWFSSSLGLHCYGAATEQLRIFYGTSIAPAVRVRSEIRFCTVEISVNPRTKLEGGRDDYARRISLIARYWGFHEEHQKDWLFMNVRRATKGLGELALRNLA